MCGYQKNTSTSIQAGVFPLACAGPLAAARPLLCPSKGRHSRFTVFKVRFTRRDCASSTPEAWSSKTKSPRVRPVFFFFGGGEPVVRGSLNIFQTRKHRRKINAHLSWAKKVRCLSDLVGFLGQVMKVILKPSMSQTETSPAAKPSGDWSWIASDSPCGCFCSQEHLANTKSSQKHKLAQPLFVCKQCTILHWPLPQTRAFAGARIGDNARAMLQHSNKEFKLRPVLYVFYV